MHAYLLSLEEAVHMEVKHAGRAIVNKLSQTYFSCNLCDKTFESRANLLKHQKIEHEDTVNTCNHAKKGTCHFGSENCWFKHDEQVITNGDKKENWK